MNRVDIAGVLAEAGTRQDPALLGIEHANPGEPEAAMLDGDAADLREK